MHFLTLSQKPPSLKLNYMIILYFFHSDLSAKQSKQLFLVPSLAKTY
jgi:hypothetical protein